MVSLVPRAPNSCGQMCRAASTSTQTLASSQRCVSLLPCWWPRAAVVIGCRGANSRGPGGQMPSGVSAYLKPEPKPRQSRPWDGHRHHVVEHPSIRSAQRPVVSAVLGRRQREHHVVCPVGFHPDLPFGSSPCSPAWPGALPRWSPPARDPSASGSPSQRCR